MGPPLAIRRASPNVHEPDRAVKGASRAIVGIDLDRESPFPGGGGLDKLPPDALPVAGRIDEERADEGTLERDVADDPAVLLGQDAFGHRKVIRPYKGKVGAALGVSQKGVPYGRGFPPDLGAARDVARLVDVSQKRRHANIGACV
jgi:hypothetical protein